MSEEVFASLAGTPLSNIRNLRLARAGRFGSTDRETTISLGASGEALLPVFRPSDYDSIDPESQIELCLHWKFAQPRIWKADRKIVVSIKKNDLERLIDGYLDRD